MDKFTVGIAFIALTLWLVVQEIEEAVSTGVSALSTARVECGSGQAVCVCLEEVLVKVVRRASALEIVDGGLHAFSSKETRIRVAFV